MDAKAVYLMLMQCLIAQAEADGVVITVSQQPRVPLAMGNYKTVVEVRDLRVK